MTLQATDPTLIGDLALVAAFRTLAGTIDFYRDRCAEPEQGSTYILLAWEAVTDGARDLAYTLLFRPDEDPIRSEVDALAATLVEQVTAPWNLTR